MLQDNATSLREEEMYPGLSDTSRDENPQRTFKITEIDDDFDVNAVTQVCEQRLPEIKLSEPVLPIPEFPPPRRPVPIPLPPPPPLNRSDRASRPSYPAIPLPLAPLPLPLPPPEGSVVFGPLPPPNPPPDRASRPTLPLPPPPAVTPDLPVAPVAPVVMQQSPRPPILTPKRFVAAAMVIVVAGAAYFVINRDGPERKVDDPAPAPTPAVPPETPLRGETKTPENALPSGPERREPENTPPKNSSPKTNKSSNHSTTPMTKRRRETLF